MRDAREVLRLKAASVSTHEIARRLGLARSTVRETVKRAQTAGLAWPLPEGMNDAALATALYAAGAASAATGGSPSRIGPTCIGN